MKKAAALMAVIGLMALGTAKAAEANPRKSAHDRTLTFHILALPLFVIDKMPA